MTEPAQNRGVALITGAGRGIGRAVAIELARLGFRLCIAARNREQLEETRRLTALAPSDCLIVLLDLADDESPRALIEATLDHFERIDVLINNAGWAPPRSALLKTGFADMDRMIAVNLRAPIALTRIAAAEMVTQGGGAIVNVASTAALTAPAGEAIYAATKAGLIAFTRSCFAELREYRIKVSVVVPGLVDSDLIPSNKRLDRSLMLSPAHVAASIAQIITAPPEVCPLEIVLQPLQDPERPRR
ncbi:MAG: SDR family oxidoreductase [Candidatus Binataceae bacterium]|jgi:short-subunit dehydrogenase